MACATRGQPTTASSDDSRKLTIAIHNAARNVVYGPQDAFRGTVYYSCDQELTASSIVVSFGAVCTIDEVDEKGAQVNHNERVITQKNMIVHEDHELVLGKTSAWGFACKFSNINRHLPTFNYQSKDRRHSAKIDYVITATIRSESFAGGVLQCRHVVDYWPKQSRTIVPGDVGTRAKQLLTIATDVVDSRPSWHHRPPLLRLKKRLGLVKTEESTVAILLEAPRFAVFERDLDIKVALRHQSGLSRRETNFYLDHVEYTLFAITRFGGDEVPQRRDLVQQHHSLPLRTTRLSHAISSVSRSHTTMKIEPRVANTLLENGTTTTVTPTFAAPDILREYRLDVDIYFSHQDRTYRARFENIDLIILPREIHHATLT